MTKKRLAGLIRVYGNDPPEEDAARWELPRADVDDDDMADWSTAYGSDDGGVNDKLHESKEAVDYPFIRRHQGDGTWKLFKTDTDCTQQGGDHSGSPSSFVANTRRRVPPDLGSPPTTELVERLPHVSATHTPRPCPSSC